MPITRTNMIDDDGSGTTGTIINNAWKQELYGQVDAFVETGIVNIPHSSLGFSGGLVVTAAQLTYCHYIRHGKEAHLRFQIAGAAISGGTAGIAVSGFPFVFTAPGQTYLAVTNLTAGGWGACQVATAAGANYVSFSRFDFAAWPDNGAGTFLYADLLAPVT